MTWVRYSTCYISEDVLVFLLMSANCSYLRLYWFWTNKKCPISTLHITSFKESCCQDLQYCRLTWKPQCFNSRSFWAKHTKAHFRTYIDVWESEEISVEHLLAWEREQLLVLTTLRQPLTLKKCQACSAQNSASFLFFIISLWFCNQMVHFAQTKMTWMSFSEISFALLDISFLFLKLQYVTKYTLQIYLCWNHYVNCSLRHNEWVSIYFYFFHLHQILFQ